MKKNIGLDVSEPKGSCESKLCPWHGMLPVRGRVFKGKVVSNKATNTAVVTWDYSRYINKYERYERRNSKVVAHNPSCIAAKEGEIVHIAECRPLSKSKRFVIVEKVE